MYFCNHFEVVSYKNSWRTSAFSRSQYHQKTSPSSGICAVVPSNPWPPDSVWPPAFLRFSHNAIKVTINRLFERSPIAVTVTRLSSPGPPAAHHDEENIPDEKSRSPWRPARGRQHRMRRLVRVVGASHESPSSLDVVVQMPFLLVTERADVDPGQLLDVFVELQLGTRPLTRQRQWQVLRCYCCDYCYCYCDEKNSSMTRTFFIMFLNYPCQFNSLMHVMFSFRSSEFPRIFQKRLNVNGLITESRRRDR